MPADTPLTAPNGERSFMHMIQAFLIEVVKRVRARLPEEALVLTAGRTILRGVLDAQGFGVRVWIDKLEDDMWPHVQVELTLGPEEGPPTHTETFDVHPDSNVEDHAGAIYARLQALLEGAG